VGNCFVSAVLPTTSARQLTGSLDNARGATEEIKMSTYLTRIELHKADGADYTRLHAAMEDEGFSRSIFSNDGTEYRLPTAEYLMDSTLTRKEVHAKARAAARSTNLKFWALTVDYGGATFNLDEV